MDRSPSYAFLDGPRPLAFSHRGLATGETRGLENSMAAFQRAVDLGFRYLETDVHATRDGVLVALHDGTLDRVTDRCGRVAELPWSEVRRARIGGSEPIPLFTDLLEAWPEVRFNVDVKDAPAVRPLIELLRRTGALDRVCVASFSDRRVAAVRRALRPRLCTSLGPVGVAQLRAVATGGLPAGLAPRYAGCAQVPERAGPLHLVTRAFVETAHRAGRQVHVWAVDDPGAMRRLLDLDVDGLMTDRADTLREVLLARGSWAR